VIYLKSALIIGASGFVGNYLVKELKRNNVNVCCSDITKNIYDDDVEFYNIDLTDKCSITNVLKCTKPDYIINLAALSSVKLSWGTPKKTFNINTIGTINLLESIKELNLNSRVLLIGSSEEYGKIKGVEKVSEEYPLDAMNPYGISKIAQEKIAFMYSNIYNMDLVMVRAFNHTGPRQKLGFVIPDFCKQIADIEILKKEPIIKVGNLDAIRDISDVRDIVRGYYMLLEKGRKGEIYNIGSGKGYKISDLLNQLISYSSLDIEIEYDKDKYRPNDTPKIICDNSKISSNIDWNPNINIEKTLIDTLNYWRNINGKG
jgi:GDP-4-dehydro-6-deoxy-D-mannose reductase